MMQKPYTPRPGSGAGVRASEVRKENDQKRATALEHLNRAISEQDTRVSRANDEENAVQHEADLEPREEFAPVDDEGNFLSSDFERIDLVSNFILYPWSDMSVKRFNWIDQTKLARAVRARNMSLFLDVLTSTSNRDVRTLCFEDFKWLCIWHKINSYLSTPLSIKFLSRYGVPFETSVKTTKIKKKAPNSTRADYLRYVDEGFAIPTMRDIELMESYKLDEDKSYLFERAQYIDPAPLADRISELVRSGDRTPSVTARIEKMQDMGPMSEVYKRIDDFATTFSDFEVGESVQVKLDTFDPEKAVIALRRSDKPEHHREADEIEKALAAKESVQPQLEEVPLEFVPWNMFPYC